MALGALQHRPHALARAFFGQKLMRLIAQHFLII
jgi:hypothetical protein